MHISMLTAVGHLRLSARNRYAPRMRGRNPYSLTMRTSIQPLHRTLLLCFILFFLFFLVREKEENEGEIFFLRSLPRSAKNKQKRKTHIEEGRITSNCVMCCCYTSQKYQFFLRPWTVLEAIAHSPSYHTLKAHKRVFLRLSCFFVFLSTNGV